MIEPTIHDSEALRASAERVLSATFAGAVQLDHGEALRERTHVSRFSLRSGPAGVPASVIVKRARVDEDVAYEPDSNEPDSSAARLFNDWAGLQLLSQAAGPDSIAPRFFGGDRAAGLFVLEDLGAGVSPDQALLGDSPAAAEGSLLALASMLGRMHAATIGWQEPFMRMRSALGPYSSGEQGYRWLADGFLATAAALDVPLRNGAAADLETVIAALANRVKTVYGYVNNHFAGHSPASARELQRLLHQRPVEPDQLGEQMSLF